MPGTHGVPFAASVIVVSAHLCDFRAMADPTTTQLRLRKAARHNCTKNERETADELRNRSLRRAWLRSSPLRAVRAPLSPSHASNSPGTPADATCLSHHAYPQVRCGAGVAAGDARRATRSAGRPRGPGHAGQGAGCGTPGAAAGSARPACGAGVARGSAVPGPGHRQCAGAHDWRTGYHPRPADRHSTRGHRHLRQRQGPARGPGRHRYRPGLAGGGRGTARYGRGAAGRRGDAGRTRPAGATREPEPALGQPGDRPRPRPGGPTRQPRRGPCPRSRACRPASTRCPPRSTGCWRRSASCRSTGWRPRPKRPWQPCATSRPRPSCARRSWIWQRPRASFATRRASWRSAPTR